jgi:histidyl-tRNA synthetase
LGSSTPLADAEVIACGWRLLQELGVSKDVVLNVNTLGDAESRARYRSALVNYFLNHESDLSEESKNRLEKNPLRILDSKDEGDRELCMKAPLIYDHLTDDAEDHYNNLRRYLANFEVPYKQNPRIVRGLDYYNHTAFEFVTTALGSQGTVLAGGRYDGLVEQMGGPSVPGVGWGAGIDRLALLLGQEDFSQPSVVIVPHDDTPESTVISILNRLRENNIIAEYAYTRSSKRHLEKAVKSKTRIVLVFSPETLERNEIMLQDLECIRLKYAPTERTQFRIFVSQNDLIPKLHKLIESFTEDNSLIPFSKRVTPTLSIADL